MAERHLREGKRAQLDFYFPPFTQFVRFSVMAKSFEKKKKAQWRKAIFPTLVLKKQVEAVLRALTVIHLH